MNHLRVFGAVFVFLVVPMFAAASQPVGALYRKALEPVPNQYIVVLNENSVVRANLPAVATEMALRSKGRVLAQYRNGVLGFGLHAPNVSALLHDPRVKMIDEAARVHLSGTDLYPWGDTTRWHLDRIDQRTNSLSYSFGWTYDGAGVDVYVVDTGVQAAHSEFRPGQVSQGGNFAGPDYANNPCGGFVNFFNGGHGTAVASLIGGSTTGLARGVNLIPVKIMDCDTSNPNNQTLGEITTVGAMWALEWILGQADASGNRSVVNMSFYFKEGDMCLDTDGTRFDCMGPFESNLWDLLEKNIVVVASANNQNTNNCATQTPARMGYGGKYDDGRPILNQVITVGGTDLNDHRHQCASCTLDPGSNYGPCVNIYAPAKLIHAAHIADANAYRDNEAYFYRSDFTVENVTSGTSFAAPLVAGAAARMLQAFPQISARDVWNEISSSATLLPANFDGDNVPGNDRLLYIGPSQ
jgi:aqualysin 1